MSKEKLTDEQSISLIQNELDCVESESKRTGNPMDAYLVSVDCVALKNVLDLINQLKEENAELKAENERLNNRINAIIKIHERNDEHLHVRLKAQERKETAKKIFPEAIKKVREKFEKTKGYTSCYDVVITLIELAKQFGVEIKE